MMRKFLEQIGGLAVRSAKTRSGKALVFKTGHELEVIEEAGEKILDMDKAATAISLRILNALVVPHIQPTLDAAGHALNAAVEAGTVPKEDEGRLRGIIFSCWQARAEGRMIDAFAGAVQVKTLVQAKASGSDVEMESFGMPTLKDCNC